MSLRENAPKAVAQPIKLRENKTRKVSALAVKRDKKATKT